MARTRSAAAAARSQSSDHLVFAKPTAGSGSGRGRRVGVRLPFGMRTRNYRDAVLYGVAILMLGVGTVVVWWLLP
ncbi:MAG: hypothetical protein QOF30_3462 [Acidimicrobiaceae bacterium]|nr:hypothetical protein [Acidimicrobiaceae bacterium]